MRYRRSLRSSTIDVAAQQGCDGPAFNGPAFPDAVILEVEVVEGKGPLDGGIDDGDVGVAAGRYDSLLRVEAHDLGGVGGGDVNEALEGHAAPDDALGVGDADAGFDAVVAASYVGDGFEAGLLLPGGGNEIGGDGG